MNASPVAAAAATSAAAEGRVFLIDRSGSIAATPASKALLASVGGPSAIVEITTAFYERFHADVYLRQFLGGLQQPLPVHAGRLGLYISEMMGADHAPWTRNCKLRDEKPIKLATGERAVVRDRSTAHYCAWNSIDRPKERVGRRFKLDDCRVWMRLFFWAVRSQGYGDDHPLFLYLQKFVAHFIAIYEVTARSFTLAESRWSAKESNIAAYVERGRYFEDVVDVPLKRAIQVLPEHEHDLDDWLYSDAN